MSLTKARASFDPSDPYDVMAETFRKQICDLVLSAEKITIYRDMSAEKQLECFVAGAMTAVVCVCFASIPTTARDYMIDYLSKCWPQAREMAEGIINNANKEQP